MSDSRTFLQTGDLSFQRLLLHVHISFLILHLVKPLLDGFSHLCLFGNLLAHLVHLFFSHLTGGRGGVVRGITQRWGGGVLKKEMKVDN